MPSIPLPSDGELPEPVANRLARLPALNIFRLLALVPECFGPWVDLVNGIFWSASVDTPRVLCSSQDIASATSSGGGPPRRWVMLPTQRYSVRRSSSASGWPRSVVSIAGVTVAIVSAIERR